MLSEAKIIFFFSVWRTRSGEEAQEKAWGVLLHPDLADCSSSEEDAANWPQHVYARRPGAHLSSQDSLPAGKTTLM